MQENAVLWRNHDQRSRPGLQRLWHRICMLALLCTLLPGISMTAMAGYTNIGVAASKTYVRRSDRRPVIIWVGDSRAMMMTYAQKDSSARSNYCFCWVNGGNVSVIGKNGKLTPFVEELIEKYSGRCVVALNLGVNGNSNPQSNADRIIRQYKRWMRRYPEVEFYVVSVNPTTVRSGPYANRNVIAVNERLYDEFEPEGCYIDTYTMLMESGLVNGMAPGMSDQVHYRWAAGEKVLRMVRRIVAKKERQG